MNRILFLLIICTFALSETILIPEDFATIQEGIDASVDGDTVLVADGDYVENLVLDKSIVLTSYAIYDNLDEWIIFDDYYFNQWVINNSHIENTRLIGSNPDDPDYGSVILITPNSDECITPEVVGFTIQGGSGTNVVREIDGQDINVILGGGILADVSDPHIHHNAFENNGSEEVYSGGASQMTSSAEDWSFDNRFENYNPRCEVEEFRLSDNLYNGNDAQYGNSMANRFHEDEFDMSGSIFDVFDCGNEENEVSSVWVKVEPAASVDYDEGAGQACAFTAPNVYVDPSIPQECLDEGCGFSNNPFKTIIRTLEMINPTEDNPTTIHLAEGTYSPETGENFPIIMMSNVIMIGEGANITTIDVQQSGQGFHLISTENIDITNLSIINSMGSMEVGWEYPEFWGGGLLLTNSNNINLSYIDFSNNFSEMGGAIAILSSSELELYELRIYDNISTTGPGGIFITNSEISIDQNSIHSNQGGSFGGIMIYNEFEDEIGYESVPKNITLTNSDIYDNTYDIAYWYGYTPENSCGVVIHSFDGGIVTIDNVDISNNDGIAGMELLISSDSKISNSLFANNSGFGIIMAYVENYYTQRTNLELINVTITENHAIEDYYYGYSLGGAGIVCGGLSVNMKNSIIYNHYASSIVTNSYYGNECNFNISFSNLEEEWEGEGNIEIDPQFTDPQNADYTLQEGSPCIDSGTADLDGDGIDDITDYFGVSPDMGAFEFGESSEIMAGDTNFDGIVDILDIVRIINQIMGNSEFNDDEFTAADFNADGIVDVLDIVQIVNYILAN